MSDWLPNDPNKGVPISELMKKHGGFKTIVEKKDWFDDTAKPRKKKNESDFDPDPEVKDGDL